MSETKRTPGQTGGPRWRWAGWSVLGMLLMVPLVAMPFTDEVAWTVSDFVVMGTLLLLVGLGFELAAWLSPDPIFRAACGLAALTMFLLIWASLAVGIIGSGDHPVNAGYLAVVAAGVLCSVAVRGRPRGMAFVMTAQAAALVLIAASALALGLGEPSSGPLEIVMGHGVFVALFLASATLFVAAGRRADSLPTVSEGAPR